MWSYQQSTGELRHDGELVGTGYSGNGVGKNNPDAEEISKTGPLPRGRYDIGAPVDTQHHGPFVLPLLPAKDNLMFGRAGFLIHGDSIGKPGCASEGCVILPLPLRVKIANSGDAALTVIT